MDTIQGRAILYLGWLSQPGNQTMNATAHTLEGNANAPVLYMELEPGDGSEETCDDGTCRRGAEILRCGRTPGVRRRTAGFPAVLRKPYRRKNLNSRNELHVRMAI